MQTSCPLCSLAAHTVDPGLQAAWGGSLDFCREDISTDMSKELLSQQSTCLKLLFLAEPSITSTASGQKRGCSCFCLSLCLPG